jgi:hypothetical protein
MMLRRRQMARKRKIGRMLEKIGKMLQGKGKGKRRRH